MTDLIPAPRPVESREDRMRHATQTSETHPEVERVLAANAHHIQPRDPNRPAPSFRTYLDEQERDQLDARAATAEQERDEALDDRDQARADLRKLQEHTTQLHNRLTATENDLASQTQALREALAERDRGRAGGDGDIARQLDILAADPGILRDWLTTCQPQPVSFGELFAALAAKLRRADPAGLGSPAARAQDQPRHPGDALAEALRNAYTTEHLAALHERLVEELDDDAPHGDPMGRLVDALFVARHRPVVTVEVPGVSR